MTKEELYEMVKAGRLIEHHTAFFRGYVSRKSEGIVEPYEGKFGSGYTLKTPFYNSSTYSHITYFVWR